eukprot:TRINITY_DN18555_c0_g1_i5.p2 TRINITY_DN18555_c0_g1~~TRINITY_DN18555_c0_g1_i5.p2  ORF type:complete len:186 (-),score=33.71 TRINITY_DN18555_c0_g1_i5:23-580(-)
MCIRDRSTQSTWEFDKSKLIHQFILWRNKMNEFDTICAIATPVGEGGISIIRISGKDSLNIASKIFKPKNKKDITKMKTYTMIYGSIVDLENSETIDDVILSYMRGPYSYTGENVIEINCHGGIIATNKVLNEIVKAGSRIAEPGEFTKRAFLNGRIDLSQAEACLLYTSPSPRDLSTSRMPSSA